MFRIAPSILAADFARLAESIKLVETAGADLIHVDVMDGHFVPNISVGIPVVRSLRQCTGLPLDVHLMVEQPARYIKDFVEAGASMISIHAEAEKHLHRSIHLIRELGASPGVALNPATSLDVLHWILPDLDFVLLMTVNPGFGGQRFIPFSRERIASLKSIIRERGLSVMVEIDGGVDSSNYLDLVRCGVDILVAGTSLFGQRDPAEVLRDWCRHKSDFMRA